MTFCKTLFKPKTVLNRFQKRATAKYNAFYTPKNGLQFLQNVIHFKNSGVKRTFVFVRFNPLFNLDHTIPSRHHLRYQNDINFKPSRKIPIFGLHPKNMPPTTQKKIIGSKYNFFFSAIKKFLPHTQTLFSCTFWQKGIKMLYISWGGLVKWGKRFKSLSLENNSACFWILLAKRYFRVKKTF